MREVELATCWREDWMSFRSDLGSDQSKIIKNGKKFSIFDNYKYTGTVVPVHSIIQIRGTGVHTQVDKGHHV